MSKSNMEKVNPSTTTGCCVALSSSEKVSAALNPLESLSVFRLIIPKSELMPLLFAL